MADLALILADAADTAENRSMLTWAAWVREQGVDLVVVAWFPGRLLERFAAVAPTLDASEVNRWRPARTLARLRLSPLARLLKGRRLRHLLEPVGAAPAVLLSGHQSLEALGWLPAKTRRVVAQLWNRDLPLSSEALRALAGCDAVAVPSDTVADAVAGQGPRLLHRSGLLVGPSPARSEGAASSRPGVAVVGIADDRTDELVAVARAIRLARVDERVHWVRQDPDERWAWALFGDPRAADLAGRVEAMAPGEVIGAEVVLVAGAGDPTPAILAGRAGVPVVAVAAAQSPVGEQHPDIAAAVRRLSAFIDGDEQAAPDEVDRAEAHAVERMGADLLALVRGS